MSDIQNVHPSSRVTRIKASLSIIIVTFNNTDTILDCLSAIPPGSGGIIVVDNASQDDTCDKIRDNFPEVTLVQSSHNTGFAAAVTRGAALTASDRLLLLNPDSVVAPNCILRLMAFADQAPHYGIYAGHATFFDGRSNRLSGLARPTVRSVLSAAFGLRAVFPGSSVFDPEAVWRQLDNARGDALAVDIVSGACMLVSRAVWDSIGGFDLRYFMYGEDADLCLRARNIGWNPVIVSNATLVHHVGGSEVSPAATQIFLLTAKTTLARTHGPPSLKLTITALFRLHVLLRLCVSFFLLRGARTSAPLDWHRVWRERAIWLRGYPIRQSYPLDNRKS